MPQYENNILVIKLGALGDFIQALGPMAAIRKHHSNGRITLLTTSPFEQIARASGYVDDILLDTRPKWFDLKNWLALRNTFNAGKFSRVYDLQNNDRTSFYFKLFSPRPEWVGVAKGASHRNTSRERTIGKAYDGHVQTLSLAGIQNITPDRLEWMKGTSDFSHIQSPYVLIVPGSAANHPEKRWPISHYEIFCRNLVEKGITPVLIGTQQESDILHQLRTVVRQSIDLAGQTSLFDLAALARGAIGAIGNDTGPMHIIAPTGCPSIVLFSGHSNPARHAPNGNNVVTMQRQNLDDLQPEEVWKAYVRQQS